ncbi:MAG: OadG family protein [Lachnospiraceae bacterium]|nr:OadG family protein [Lachnospiraceae bacterium]
MAQSKKGMVKRNMKKFLSILCICVCLLGLTACETAKPVNQKDSEVVSEYSQFLAQYLLNEDADMYAYFFADQVKGLSDFTNGGAEFTQATLGNIGLDVDGNGFISGIDSWNKAVEEIGKLKSIDKTTVKYSTKGDTIIVDLDAMFEKRSAVVEFIYEDNLNKTLTSYAVNINYTFGEKMQKAGLNTVLGMGTVFIVLILLSLLISCFKFVNQAQTASENKKKAAMEAAKPEVKELPVQEEIQEDETVDDEDEIAAVISAAIAAYESENGVISQAESGGYYVRSIRRRNNSKWNRN